MANVAGVTESGAMARFTFSAGNAQVLARAPLYALGALVAVLVPRSSKQWVFGSGAGLGEGSLVLHDYSRRVDATRRLTWLASSRTELAEARARGMRARLKRGPRGLWATLRAGVVVVTHGFGDVNRFGVSGARVVQLWHGIPLKRLHLDTGAALRLPLIGSLPGVGRLMARLYRRAGAQISLFPVASELVAARIRSAFGVPASRVVVTGDVRDDVLLAGTAESRTAAARELIERSVGAVPADARLVLYAPTWRDGDLDPAIPDSAEWMMIAEWATRCNVVLLVRSHPLGAGSYAEGAASSDRVRMLGREQLVDITPALPAMDVLVTDYSSIAFDAAIASVPSVFLATDLDRYLATRGLYAAYRTFSGGEPAGSWAEALDRVEAVLQGGQARKEALSHAAWLRDEHVDLLDGRATERVHAAILSLLGETPTTSRTAAGTAAGSTPDAAAGAAAIVPERRERLVIDAVTVRAAADVNDAGLIVELSAISQRLVDAIAFVGARHVLHAELSQDGDRLTATVNLIGERWGEPGLAPPSGDYRLETRFSDAVHSTARAEVADGAARESPTRHPLLRATVLADAGTLVVRVEAPLADDERGAAHQRRLERAYRRRTATPENAVFFESFYSQTAACNPRAIDRELARVRPDVVRYWSVVDRSVAVPDGAVPIVEGSAEWWRVRAEARVLVVNDWLRKRWMPRPHQTVLQTWHGTMLKRLALDRDGTGVRTRIAVRREARRWNVLLAQNDYAAEIFRSAYAFTGPIWVEGYPRTDVLVHGDRNEVRARLGLRPDQRAVLYAPTWRDDAREFVDYLDLPSLPAALAELPGEHVVLVRGHSRTLRFGRDVDAPGLLDVTTYPDIADLLLAADVVITDYSSLMFDLASTDTPLLLFVPDLERYSSQLRGFYFDLVSEAPAPVVHHRSEVIEQLAALASGSAASVDIERRAAWRSRFTPLDDGAASQRVVSRMLAEGMLAEP